MQGIFPACFDVFMFERASRSFAKTGDGKRFLSDGSCVVHAIANRVGVSKGERVYAMAPAGPAGGLEINE